MNALEAHNATVNAILKEELTQKVLLDIETMAAQGKFQTAFESDLDVDKIQDITNLLKTLGYEATLALGYRNKTIYIRW